MPQAFQFGLDTLLIVSAVQFVLGGFAFWLFAGQSRSDAPAGMDPQEIESVREKHREDTKRIESAMQQMYRLTGSIGQNVGEHSARVQKINDDLAGAEHGDTAAMEATLLATVAQMKEANEKLQGDLRAAEAKMAEQASALESQMAMARTDALTGVLNRRAFDDELQRRVAEYLRYRTPVSLLLFDIDHFKKFNDTYGHQTGDEVLCHVACTLSMVMREVDLVCRYGGEEFAVILPATEQAGAVLAAERARAAVERMVVESAGQLLKVTVSGGVAAAVAEEDVERLVSRADQGLYASKKAGRNCIHLHDGKQLTCNGAPAPKAEEPKPAPKPTPEKPAADTGAKDPLQLIPNREAFIEDVRKRVEQHRRYHAPVTVLYCGVDDFESITSRHGREAGNVVLRAVAQFLKAVLRELDMPARISDDRFAVVLAGIDGAEAAAKAERIRQAIEKCKLPGGQLDNLRFTASLGIAEIEEGDDAEALMNRGTGAFGAAAATKNVVVAESGGEVHQARLETADV